MDLGHSDINFNVISLALSYSRPKKFGSHYLEHLEINKRYVYLSSIR